LLRKPANVEREIQGAFCWFKATIQSKAEIKRSNSRKREIRNIFLKVMRQSVPGRNTKKEMKEGVRREFNNHHPIIPSRRKQGTILVRGTQRDRDAMNRSRSNLRKKIGSNYV